MAPAEDEDDPFACFGESDEDGDNESSSAWVARSLVEQANSRMAKRDTTSTPAGTFAFHQTDSDQSTAGASDVVSDMKELVLWPDSPPLYVGPIVLVESLPYGGGRGYVAKRDLEPGTLALVEEPMIQWPDKQLGKALDLMISVQYILRQPLALEIIHDMEDFHPTKQEVDSEDRDLHQIHNMMQSIQDEHKNHLDELAQLANDLQLVNRNGTDITFQDVARLFLALRYNGLETGVYRHVAMLNHACRFNCVKYQPTGDKPYSEVRTTRPVLAGESLTISYVPHNGLLSHATRRRHLWDQHRFDVGKDLVDSDQRRMELVGKSLPPSSIDHVDETAVTFRIESACHELEDLYHDAVANLESIDEESSQDVFDQLRALEVSSQELCIEARRQLQNDRHLLLIACLRLHLDTCDSVQTDSRLTASQRIKLQCRLVATARKLIELQKAHFGNDHYDIAQSNLELAQAVQEMLARAPKQLLDLGLENMTTFESCSAVEHQARKEYERVKALYPRDVEQRILQQK